MPSGRLSLGSPVRAIVVHPSAVPTPVSRSRSASRAPRGLPRSPVRIAVLLVSLYCLSLSTIDCPLFPVSWPWLLCGGVASIPQRKYSRWQSRFFSSICGSLSSWPPLISRPSTSAQTWSVEVLGKFCLFLLVSRGPVFPLFVLCCRALSVGGVPSRLLSCSE